MGNRSLVIFAAVICLTAGWGILFAGWILSFAPFQIVSPWAVAALLVAGGFLTVVSHRSARTRGGLLFAILLTAVSLVSVRVAQRDSATLESSWWPGEARNLAGTLLAVGEEFARLEEISAATGRLATQWFESGGFDKDGRSLRDRVAAFQALDSLAAAVSGGGGLTRGTEIGLQVFDAAGRRIVWAGWPQAVGRHDIGYINSGVELVYSREVTLYRILTRIIPVKDSKGRVALSVVVDLPLEVNYRVNNRFLKSAGLADKYASDRVADIVFDYTPGLANLPHRLDRFKKIHQQNLARRERMIEQREERIRNENRAGKTNGKDRQEQDAPDRRRRATEDSVLTYFPFPPHIEAISEISGDKTTGLQGRVLIRSPFGNPVVGVRAIGHPFRHFANGYQERWISRARGLIVAALLAMFVVAMLALGRRGYHAWMRGAVFVGFLVLLRYSMLSLRGLTIGGEQKFFDPTVFATPLLGGIMRSAGDLLITGILFVVALYGLMKMIRSRGDDALTGGDEGKKGSGSVLGFVVEGVAIAAVLYAVYRLARGFSGIIVINANPRLIGETMKLTDSNVLVLHLGTFLTLAGILLTGMLAVWAMFRVSGWRNSVKASWTAFALLLIVSFAGGLPELAVISAALLLFIVLAPHYVQREDLVSIAIVAFCLVVITSGLTYTFFTRDYDGLRKVFIREQAAKLIDPRDDWKSVILGDILDEYTRTPRIRNALRAPGTPEAQRLAFELWADALLSRLGTSCAIHVLTDRDSVVSDFSVDMPYRLRIGEGEESLDAPIENDWAVLDISRSTPQGVVRAYRGIVYVEDERQIMEGSPLGRVIGKVVVDLPYFFESLEWASRTGPRTPVVLRNVQEGGVASRVEEPEALLLARLDGRRIYESSSEALSVGTTIPLARFEGALDDRWPLLYTHSGRFRVLIEETREPGRYLLAGFAVPSPLRHLIRWSTLFSLYLFYAALIIVAIIALGAIPYLKELLPTLTPGRRFGFQQKLLASFLLMALVPAVILGLFSVDFIENRFLEENRMESFDKLFSARRALVNLLHGEMQLFLGSAAEDRLYSEEGYTDAVVTGPRLVRVFDEGGFASFADVSAEDLYILRDGRTLYIGVFSSRRQIVGEMLNQYVRLYYARRIDASLLGDIADQISGDVNVFDNAGNLTASSQEGLLAGGLISAIINGDAYVKVSLFGSDHVLATERAGRYSYQVAYLPVTTLGGPEDDALVSDGGRPARAALSVPLLFLPESYSLEVQKATSVVLGIFALLFVATIGLGLLLARGVFEPLRALLEGTRRISRGDLDVRLPMRRSDEIGIVVSAFNEMTARLSESQRTLEERRQYLETILASIGSGVISTGADDRIRTVNRAARRILGIDAAAAIGRTADEMVDAELAPEIFRLLRDGMDAREPFIAAEVELLRDSRRATVKYMLTRLDVDDRYLGTLLVFEDLTELIQTKKLSAWVEMARQIAHEIKNPLTPIRISTQFMQRAYEQKSDKFDQIFREGSETIIEQVDVLKRIASEFSSYGRMQQLVVSAHQLAPLLDNIVKPYLQNSAGVAIELVSGVPGADVLVDTEAVRKICTNLIENALDAMPEGGRLVVSCREESHHDVDYIRLSFSDTGPGLSDEVAEKLFEPYFSTKTTGTGLGLAICRSLSQEMGGDVDVHNVPGGGVDASVMLRRAW